MLRLDDPLAPAEQPPLGRLRQLQISTHHGDLIMGMTRDSSALVGEAVHPCIPDGVSDALFPTAELLLDIEISVLKTWAELYASKACKVGREETLTIRCPTSDRWGQDTLEPL